LKSTSEVPGVGDGQREWIVRKKSMDDRGQDKKHTIYLPFVEKI
jgi:hypothetical protein